MYLMRKKGHFALCYLDDFVGAARTEREAQTAYRDLLDITQELGRELSPSKCIPPTTDLQWLGFRINTANMKIEIPRDKLEETITECTNWTLGKSASRRDLQRLIGRLQHIAKCIRPARRFMNRILQALRNAPFTGKHPVTEEMVRDIEWFKMYAKTSNGLVLLQSGPKQHWIIECDSSLTGARAYSQSHYYSEVYGPDILKQKMNIAQLEALNLIVALKSLVPSNPEKYIIQINTDNSVSQTVLTEGTGRDPILCGCAREIWLFAAKTSTEVIVKHKAGKDLILADALSRRHHDAEADKKAHVILGERPLTQITPAFVNILTSEL